MFPNRPYLIRAIYEWILDNNMTPHVLVDAQISGVVVPKEHIEDGKIVLNISPSAVHAFVVSNEFMEFKARFSGKVRNISIPVPAVEAIYAHENGQGMGFDPSEYADTEGGGDSGKTIEPPQVGKGKPKLKLVKK